MYRHRRTDASNALNSCSFEALYAAISLAASERASLSLWTRSVSRGRSKQPHSGARAKGVERTLAGLLNDLRGLFLGFK